MSVRPDAEKSANLYYAVSIPPELEKKISEESDAAVLKNWLKIAAAAKSIEEFIQKIQ